MMSDESGRQGSRSNLFWAAIAGHNEVIFHNGPIVANEVLKFEVAHAGLMTIQGQRGIQRLASHVGMSASRKGYIVVVHPLLGHRDAR